MQLDGLLTSLALNGLLPTKKFGAVLFNSLIPWIDSPEENGQTREEWKGMTETNKILMTEKPITIESTCVRVPIMRCHSQSFIIKLKKNINLAEIEDMLVQANKWVGIIDNNEKPTKRDLTPLAVSGKLDVLVGRLRKSLLGPDYLSIFSVGDQLLWGAAEPIMRMLRILTEHLSE